MLTITPIGSCRIVNPLRLCHETFGFRLNMARTYGYCHTAAEAVQYMHFLKKEFDPNPALWDLISSVPDQIRVRGQEHKPSDFYIVELCSSKEMRVGSQYIQLNFMYNYFRNFVSNRDKLVPFTHLATIGDAAALGDWLDHNWSDSPEQVAESEVLRQIRIETTTEEGLKRDMQALLDGLGEVLFVTHVDALTTAGVSVPGRPDLIEMVKAVGSQLGARVYDPTKLMQEVGQKDAIEDYSTGLAHFTDSFSLVMMDEWYDQIISPMIVGKVLDNPDDAIPRILAPHTKAFLATGDAGRRASIARLLNSVAVQFPENPEVRQMKADAAVGDAGAEPERLYRASSANAVLAEPQ